MDKSILCTFFSFRREKFRGTWDAITTIPKSMSVRLTNDVIHATSQINKCEINLRYYCRAQNDLKNYRGEMWTFAQEIQDCPH